MIVGEDRLCTRLINTEKALTSALHNFLRKFNSIKRLKMAEAVWNDAKAKENQAYYRLENSQTYDKFRENKRLYEDKEKEQIHARDNFFIEINRVFTDMNQFKLASETLIDTPKLDENVNEYNNGSISLLQYIFNKNTEAANNHNKMYKKILFIVREHDSLEEARNELEKLKMAYYIQQKDKYTKNELNHAIMALKNAEMIVDSTIETFKRNFDNAAECFFNTKDLEKFNKYQKNMEIAEKTLDIAKEMLKNKSFLIFDIEIAEHLFASAKKYLNDIKENLCNNKDVQETEAENELIETLKRSTERFDTITKLYDIIYEFRSDIDEIILAIENKEEALAKFLIAKNNNTMSEAEIEFKIALKELQDAQAKNNSQRNEKI